MSISSTRAAGLLLMLTAVATAISVFTRLSSSQEPFAGSPVQLPIILDTGQYAISGGARMLSGFALVAAAVFLRLTLRSRQPVAAGVATTLLELSGTATAISGAAMLALAVQIPQATESAALLAWEMPGWIETIDSFRWIAGKVGFALAGLGLIALGPVQWRMGRLDRIIAAAGVIIGFAMLFIWVDAATVVHRMSGIAFLVWLIISALWLLLRSLTSSRTTV